MNNYVELPLMDDPIFSTYHYQGPGTAIIVSNPSIRNWYLERAVNLVCTRKFLQEYTSPEISIEYSSWIGNPHFEKMFISLKYTKGYLNSMIKELLDDGYYVNFSGVDDYYVQGKSWYKERHFSHDGLICGYNQDEKTYCIYAYDSNWIYKKFWTPQKCFNNGRIAMKKAETYGKIYALKPKSNEIGFNLKIVYNKLLDYLNSTFEKYPKEGEGSVLGIIVHEYIAEYVNKLFDGSIPYEKMDRRVFRLIWDHKKAMHERIVNIEQKLGLDSEYSKKISSVG